MDRSSSRDSFPRSTPKWPSSESITLHSTTPTTPPKVSRPLWQKYVSEVDGLQAGVRVLDRFSQDGLERQKGFAKFEAEGDYEYNTGLFEEHDFPFYQKRQQQAIEEWEVRQAERLARMGQDDEHRKRFEYHHRQRTQEWPRQTFRETTQIPELPADAVLLQPYPQSSDANVIEDKDVDKWYLDPSWNPFDSDSSLPELVNPIVVTPKNSPRPLHVDAEELQAHIEKHQIYSQALPQNAKKLPSANQWTHLQELRVSSNVLFKRFLRLTSQSHLQGMKKLRRMYHGKAGILDAGITSFKQTLSGREPKTLKDVFAFTWLSYVISKLLHKHGRAQDTNVNVLGDIGRWRLAIKKERDRLIYDEAVKIMWPESVRASIQTEGSGLHDGDGGSGLPGGKASHSSSGNTNFSGKNATFDQSPLSDAGLFEDHPSPSVRGDSMADFVQPLMQHHAEIMANEIESFGFQDHTMQLLGATSSNENLTFKDFLNLPSSLVVGDDHENPWQSPWLDPLWSPREQSSQVPSLNEELDKPYEPPDATPQSSHTNSPVDKIPRSCHGLSDTSSDSPPEGHLQPLEQTNMFLIVIDYLKYIGELTGLLFRLSGLGITDRRRELKIEDEDRPIHAIGEFINDTSRLIFAPLRRELATDHEGFAVIIYLAETFVRLGNLQTVREIEEYIIELSRLFIQKSSAFGQIIAQTLKQCLAAADELSWDLVYPGIEDNEEEYSIEYINERLSDAKLWATIHLSFPVEDSLPGPSKSHEPKPTSTRRDRAPLPNQRPSKRQRTSSPAPDSSSSSSTPRTGDGPTQIFCPHTNCTKSFTGAYEDARVNLRRHIRTTHEACTKLRCPSCGHESTRRDNLRKHFLTVHKGAELPPALACKARA